MRVGRKLGAAPTIIGNCTLYCGDSWAVADMLPEQSVHTIVTSPPYWGLRDYNDPEQFGLEATQEEYVAKLVDLFRRLRRVLRDDGTVWLNLGDSYNGSTPNRTGQHGYDDGRSNRTERFSVGGVTGLKPKDLCGIPWRVAFALQADGWWLRQDIIWHKPNSMPESVTDRCTKSHEYIFLLTKSSKYFYDAEAVKEPVLEVSLKRAEYGWDCDRPSTKNASMGGDGIHTEKMGMRFVNPLGRNKRSVWTITTKPFKEAHFATFPPDLIQPCVLAGCSDKCCPVCGKGWERVTERIPMGKTLSKRTADKHDQGLATACGGTMTSPPISHTIGFRPSCSCPQAEPVPGTVLDPFSGSGTTGLVCIKTGRKYVGIELNPEYLKMSRQRIEQAHAQGRLEL